SFFGICLSYVFFFFQAEDGIRDLIVTGVQTCALPIFSFHILKLISREAAGQRSISEPQVQQNIRDTLRSRKEQLLRSAYLAIARDDAQVQNYLAQQVIEAAGKLPEAAKTSMPQRSIGH